MQKRFIFNPNLIKNEWIDFIYMYDMKNESE